MTEEEVDGVWNVRVTGELDLHSAPGLCARLEAHRGRTVAVDLRGLRFCDSCGLRALLCESRETRIAGGRMTVVAPDGGAVRRLFDVTGLQETLAGLP